MGAWAGVLFLVFFANASVAYHTARAEQGQETLFWSDAGGYYCYLPGLFHYGFRAHRMPEGLEARTGAGFTADRTRDRLVTKYTYGTALFQLPFYAAAEIGGPRGSDPWDLRHQQAIACCGVFYWTAGLVLLGLALHARWRPGWWLIVLVLGCVAFGTNTFYSAFRQPGYSHAVSFFLVSLALYLTWHGHGDAPSRRRTWLFAFTCAALVVVRVFDALLVAALCALWSWRFPLSLRTWRWYATMGTALLLLALPQMAYWYAVHGTPLIYSYGDERFTALASPRIAEVVLAPENGLLPHAPVLFLVPLGMIVLWSWSRRLALLLMVLFAAAIYGFASWHAWHFGCSYGMRPFVQYVPVAAVPLLALFAWLRDHARPVLHGLVPLLVLVCFINYRAMLQYPGCYFSGNWAWSGFSSNMVHAFFSDADLRP